MNNVDFSTIQMAALMNADISDLKGAEYAVSEVDIDDNTVKISIVPKVHFCDVRFSRVEMMPAKVVDSKGAVYRVTDVTASPELGYPMLVSIEPVKPTFKDCIYQAERPDFDGIAKYIFDCMVTENLINPDCKIGVIKDRIKAFVKASAYLDNNRHADPETRPE